LVNTVIPLAADAGTVQAVEYPALLLLVFLGSLVPGMPTGVLVSAAAVTALYVTPVPLHLALVVAVAAAAAWCADAILYRLAARAGRRGLTPRMRDRIGGSRIEAAQTHLTAHGRTAFVLSRLVPGGRWAMIGACVLSGWPLRRFALANLAAAVAWGLAYTLVGVAGGALFPSLWQGLVAAVGIVLLGAAAAAAYRWVRDRTAPRP
jgi:membrane protein DedA with SNARE-associated domain